MRNYHGWLGSLWTGPSRLNSPLAYESNQNLLGAGFGIYLTMPWGLYFHADFAKPLREVKSAGLPLEGTKSSTTGSMQTWGGISKMIKFSARTFSLILSFLWAGYIYGLPEGTVGVVGEGSFEITGNEMVITAPDGSVFEHQNFNVMEERRFVSCSHPRMHGSSTVYYLKTLL